MLLFDLRHLSAGPIVVAASLTPDDDVWQAGDQRPFKAIEVTGRLSAAGSGQFYWHGRLTGILRTECSRCLEGVTLDVGDDMQVVLAEPDAEGFGDPDVYPLDPRATNLDLGPAIREHWLLAVPSFPLCRKGCKGLCPSCGRNRNTPDCQCSLDSAHDRLATPRHMRSRKT
ncbi:MAG: hypothetical protein NVS4B3_02700 [Gemmatimonadaceae bacterium]